MWFMTNIIFFGFLWIIKSFQDFMLKGTNKLIPFVAAGLTYPSLPLSLPVFVSVSLFLFRSSLSSSLVPMAHQTWGGWVAWLPERKKLKSLKGISPPLLPLMNAVFCGRQSGKRSTQKDDRAHSRGECVSACVPLDCPFSDVRTGGFWHVDEQVKGKNQPEHFNSALVVFSWLSRCCHSETYLIECKIEKKKDIGSISVERIDV